ncbi:hypothetical protein SDC9_141856 [bioreactor metagenome]|uniref:Uncharacterized protein n=1 Tax=bioreactor metagenome TaxID=1076179 RepID=A0A645E002_9ZZZZ
MLVHDEAIPIQIHPAANGKRRQQRNLREERRLFPRRRGEKRHRFLQGRVRKRQRICPEANLLTNGRILGIPLVAIDR